MEGLTRLTRLQILDLSSNKIKSIDGISTLLQLRRLVLAFNRISTLEGMRQVHGDAYQLEYLDLNGNKLSSLQELRHLGGCIHLKEVVFQALSKGNPFCSNPRYKATVYDSVPAIEMLDNQPVSRGSTSFVPPAPESRPATAPTVSFASMPSAGTDDRLQKQKDANRELRRQLKAAQDKCRELMEQVNNSTQRDHDQTLEETRHAAVRERDETVGLLEEQREKNRKLRKELHTTQDKCRDLTEELVKLRVTSLKQRNLEIRMDETQEAIAEWKQKCHAQTKELEEERERRQSAKRELESMQKRYDDLCDELERAQAARHKKDKGLDDMQARVAEFIKQNTDLMSENKKLRNDMEIIRGEMEHCRKREKDSSSSLQQLQETLAKVHSQHLDAAIEATSRFQECMIKLQKAETRIEELLHEEAKNKQEAESLRNRLKDSELNFEKSHIEVEEEFKRELYKLSEQQKLALERLKTDHAKQMREKLEASDQMYRDMEEEYSKALKEDREQLKRLQAESEDQQRTISDLKQLLKLSVQKEVRASALVEEHMSQNKQLKEQIQSLQSNKADNSLKVKEALADERIKQRELELELKSALKKITETTRQLEEQHKMSASLQKEKDELIQQARRFESDLIELKTRAKGESKTVDKLNQELSQLRDQVHELNDALQVKSKMLEDQNDSIESLKQMLEKKDDEIHETVERRRGRESDMERRLIAEMDASEKLKAKLDVQEQTTMELEERIIELKRRLEKERHLNEDLRSALEEKQSVVKYVEQEVEELKKIFEAKEKKLIDDKKEKEMELRKVIQGLELNLVEKKRQQDEGDLELSRLLLIIEKKEKELMETKRNLAEAEGQLKSTKKEMETQKQLAADNMKKLNMVFQQMQQGLV
eukprot:GILJ01018754.1.p1 GENE.GILJ01018754.1~~GILJ01018754.1.p1  ORF type:complete len:909 (-),score=207.05 GILJ01018754.1:13-2667(-)